MASKKLEIKNFKIEEVHPYENNPRFNKDAVSKVASSIKKFGFKNPILVDKNNVIIAGHTRLEAAKKLGLEEVPCIVASDLTEKQAKALRLADNKVAEFSTWDYLKLDEELKALGDSFDFQDFTERAILDAVTIPATSTRNCPNSGRWQRIGGPTTCSAKA